MILPLRLLIRLVLRGSDDELPSRRLRAEPGPSIGPLNGVRFRLVKTSPGEEGPKLLKAELPSLKLSAFGGGRSPRISLGDPGVGVLGSTLSVDMLGLARRLREGLVATPREGEATELEEPDEATECDCRWPCIERIEETDDEVDLRPRRLLPVLLRYDADGVIGEVEDGCRWPDPLLLFVKTRGRDGYVARDGISGLVCVAEDLSTLVSVCICSIFLVGGFSSIPDGASAVFGGALGDFPRFADSLNQCLIDAS